MNRKTTNSKARLWIVCALGAALGATGIASAAGPGYPGPSRAPEVHLEPAGTLVINNQYFRINDSNSIPRQIANRFLRLGYDAWTEGGRAYVRVGYHQPSVRWINQSHGMRITWVDGCIILDPSGHIYAGPPRVVPTPYYRRGPRRIYTPKVYAQTRSWKYYNHGSWRSSRYNHGGRYTIGSRRSWGGWRRSWRCRRPAS